MKQRLLRHWCPQVHCRWPWMLRCSSSITKAFSILFVATRRTSITLFYWLAGVPKDRNRSGSWRIAGVQVGVNKGISASYVAKVSAASIHKWQQQSSVKKDQARASFFFCYECIIVFQMYLFSVFNCLLFFSLHCNSSTIDSATIQSNKIIKI